MHKIKGWTKKERLSFVKHFEGEIRIRGLEPLLGIVGQEYHGWIILQIGDYLAIISKRGLLEATIYDKQKLEDPIVDSLTTALKESGVDRIFYHSDLLKELDSK